jgi:signal transduction histidine kinase
MKATRARDWYIVKPWRLFVVVLGLIFSVEAAVMFLLPVLFPSSVSPSIVAIFDACLLTSLLAPLFWVLVIRPLRSLAETRTELLSRLLTAQEEERGRIARDLHDSLGQSLTCLTVGLRAVEERSADEAIRAHVQELRRIGSETHQEIRRMATALRPSVLDDLGLAAALERYLDDLNKVQGIGTTLEVQSLGPTRLPSNVETALYRITQEATTNALRHGAATDIRVTVQRTPQFVELVVRDNGCGFDVPAALRRSGEAHSFGVASMRERVNLLSGSLTIDSHSGAGTTVVVRIPLPQRLVEPRPSGGSR